MRVERESGIEFDFSAASLVVRHDEPRPFGEGNVMWKGVDFRLEDPVVGKLWLEVKSWDPSRVSPRLRGANRRRFVVRLTDKMFAADIRGKFYGTSAFLAWTGAFVASEVTYVVLLQPPRALDKALLSTLMQRMSSAFPYRRAPWTHTLSIAVVDLADWNRLYPHLPGRVL